MPEPVKYILYTHAHVCVISVVRVSQILTLKLFVVKQSSFRNEISLITHKY